MTITKMVDGYGFLPTDIISNILSWLPVQTLLRFKSVSPEWYHLITSPTFVKIHLQQQQQLTGGGGDDDPLRMFVSTVSQIPTQNSVDLNCGLVLPGLYCTINYYQKTNLYTVDLNSILNDYDNTVINKDAALSLKRVPVMLQGDFHIVPIGSCNGIVCLRNVDGWGFTLLNPATRSHFKLPNLKVDKENVLNKYKNRKISLSPNTEFMSYGFGYDCCSDDYKVVKIVQSYRIGEGGGYLDEVNYCTKIMIYSWRKNEWNTSHDKIYALPGSWSDFPWGNQYHSCGTPYENGLNWLALKKVSPWEEGQLVILTLDLNTGIFARDNVTVLPVVAKTLGYNMLSNLKGDLHYMAVVEKRGRGLSHYNGGMVRPYFEIEWWMLKKDNYGGGDRGTNLSSWCRLGGMFLYSMSPAYANLVSYSQRRGEIMMHGVCSGSNASMVEEFSSLDLRTGKIKKTRTIDFNDRIRRIETQLYVESLVSLDNPLYRGKSSSARPRNEEDDLKQEVERLRAEISRLRKCIDRKD